MLTFNYPTVAKTLRDTFGHKGKKKCKEDKEKHQVQSYKHFIENLGIDVI